MLIGISLDEAVAIVQKNVSVKENTEILGVLNSAGRICAENISAPIDNPPFDKSPLDGYALRAEDTKNASKDNPVKLSVVDKLCAGDCSNLSLKTGQAVRIMTGAMMPEGADCVIKQESTDYGENEVNIYESLEHHQNYCFKGEDFKKGEILITKGEKLTYVHLALLACIGCPTVTVYRQPRVAVLVTGDELMPPSPGEELQKGKIYNSNLFLIAARLKELSINPVYLQHVGDDIDLLEQKLIQATATADFVITTGGVSVGQKDIFHEVLPKIGADRKFWRVNIMPGTPVMFSTYKHVPILSLSGNPFAATTTFELLARPMLAKLAQDPSIMTTSATAVMGNDFSKKSSTTRFIRGHFNNNIVTLPSAHSSGVLASMKGCNCLVMIEAGNNGLKKGDHVNVILL